ncbi:phosphatase PAP2 family protein [Sphingomonadaceae bacterium OTU29THOMA1]|nr:phosphatase PAP2 family protein [Sphingomonadaceae bacterium OTU29THOMA1]
MLKTSRGEQAVSDVREDVSVMLADFSEAAGRRLTPENAPALAALLLKMRPDVAAAVNAAKQVWKRQRPFLIDRGAICQPREQVADSYDYPSGHTSWGTAVALVLAELLPDRATPILERGRAYGDSRFICGVHNLSAVESGRLAAASIVARLHGDPQFRQDLDRIRIEITQRRAP